MNGAASRAAAAVLAAGLAFAGCGAGQSSSPAPNPTPTGPNVPSTLSAPLNLGPLIPTNNAYFGGFEDTNGLGNGNNATSLAALETQLGRKFALDLHFFGFTTQWPSIPVLDDDANGRIPVSFWDCGLSNAQIAAGTADSTLQARATAVAAYGRPIMVSFFYEINVPSGLGPRARPLCYDANTDGPGTAFSAAQFIAAWDHIRAIFAAAGATNAIWVWTVAATSGAGVAAQDPRPYYPGDSEVDWVGIDDWDFNDVGFSQTFSVLYNLVAPIGKPILITETGASAANQTAFFSGAVPALQSAFPLVKGFMYYDQIGATIDWRVTPDSFPAFAAMANDPYFSARYTGP